MALPGWLHPFRRRPTPAEQEAGERVLRRAYEEEVRRDIETAEIPPRQLSDEEAWAESGEWFAGFSSSNVQLMSYDTVDERLVIQYHDGSIYAYQPVNMPMAIDFYRAGSKGRWIWDNLRERGTVYGYKVPYTLISGPAQRILGMEARRWMRSEESRRRHGQMPPSGRTPQGAPIRPRNI